jgi:hypothetical protein
MSTVKITFEFNKLSDAAEFLDRHAPTVQTEPLPFEREPIVVDPQMTATEVLARQHPVAATELPGVTEDPAPKARKPRVKKADIPTMADAVAAGDAIAAASVAPLTVVDLREALRAVLAMKGADATNAILATYRVARIGELPVTAYAQFVDSCKVVCK